MTFESIFIMLHPNIYAWQLCRVTFVLSFHREPETNQDNKCRCDIIFFSRFKNILTNIGITKNSIEKKPMLYDRLVFTIWQKTGVCNT